MKYLQLNAVFLIIVLSSCANLITNFDQNSYDSATQLKSTSIALMGKAMDPARKHQDEINDLQSRLSFQVSYEEGKGKSNAVSAKQWKILSDSEGSLLGAFLKDWTEEKTFSHPYVQEKTEQVAQAFNELIRLEGAKTR